MSETEGEQSSTLRLWPDPANRSTLRPHSLQKTPRVSVRHRHPNV